VIGGHIYVAGGYAAYVFSHEAVTFCGDINGDEQGPDVSDLTFIVDYLFISGPPPASLSTADIDGSGSLDVADLTYLVEYLFSGGPPPAC